MSDLPPDPFGPASLRPAGSLGAGPNAFAVAVEAVPLNLDCPDREWCAPCALPSGLGYRFRVLVNGADRGHTLSFIVCADCGALTRRKI